VLALFTTLRSRFPNLVVGQITRESVKRALQSGISAEQVGAQVVQHLSSLKPMLAKIISYLSTHAHPQMRKNVRDATYCRLFLSLPTTRIESADTGYRARPDKTVGAREE
jgi:hypothetical protein